MPGSRWSGLARVGQHRLSSGSAHGLLGDRGKCWGSGFWCTDGYAVCGYAEAAGTRKHIVVSVDEVGVSKTPGLRVNAPPSARADSTFHGLFRSQAAWLELQPLDPQPAGTSTQEDRPYRTPGHQFSTNEKLIVPRGTQKYPLSRACPASHLVNQV